MRRTDNIMGMPISLDIPDTKDPEVFKEAFRELRIVDEQFSPYKPTSELALFRTGKLKPEQVSIGMKEIMKACLEAEELTDGFFSARFDGSFDPSGYVKGWALHEIGQKLRLKGHETFCISAGGDVWASSSGDKTWNIAIQDPEHRSQTVGVISVKNMAVATSGNYERGNHIINPKTGEPAEYFACLTVAGPDIIAADILATAAYAMGKPGLKFIDGQPGYEVLAIDDKKIIYASTGMKALLEAT